MLAPALIAAGILLAASGGKPEPHELLHATGTYSGAGRAPPPPRKLKINSSDITFAIELARIHEPSEVVLYQFEGVLRANGLNAQAKELVGAPPGSGPPRAKVGDLTYADIMGQLFPDPYFSGDVPTGPTADAGTPPPGWSLTLDGWYADPITLQMYNYTDAWALYWSRQSSSQGPANPSAGGSRRVGSLSRARVGDILSDATSSLSSQAQGAVSQAQGAAQSVVSQAQGAAQSAVSQAQGAVANVQQQASQMGAAAQQFVQRPSLSSLSSLASALPKNLPGVGQVQGQIANGAKLLSQISSGDISDAVGSGIGMAATIAGDVLQNLGQKGQEVAAILEGAAAGAAAGATLGPYGAAAGAIIGAAMGFAQGEFAGTPLPPVAVQQSQATAAITANLNGWINQWGATYFGHPPGWALADYLAAAFPPKQMDRKEANRFVSLGVELIQWAGQFDKQGLFYDHRTLAFGMGQSTPTILIYWQTNLNPGSLGPYAGVAPISPATFVSWQIPVCSGVFWLWGNPSAMGSACSISTGGGDNDEGYVTSLSYPAGKPPGSASQLKAVLLAATVARGGKTQEWIVENAIKRRPSARWFAIDLYGAWLPTGGKLMGNTWSTVYWDPDTLNAMATVLGMLNVGASTQAIVSELMLQVTILHDEGQIVESSKSVSPGVFALLDDYLYMAHQEHWESHPKPAQLGAWIAHYAALATKQERNTMESWIASRTPISRLRTQLLALN